MYGVFAAGVPFAATTPSSRCIGVDQLPSRVNLDLIFILSFFLCPTCHYLTLSSSWYHSELKKLDDKQMLTEVHLTESRIYHELQNIPKCTHTYQMALFFQNFIVVFICCSLHRSTLSKGFLDCLSHRCQCHLRDALVASGDWWNEWNSSLRRKWSCHRVFLLLGSECCFRCNYNCIPSVNALPSDSSMTMVLRFSNRHSKLTTKGAIAEQKFV